MTAIRENMREEVAEGGSCRLTGTLTDEAGAPVTLAGLQTLKLWLYDADTGTPISVARTNQDIKNANGGTVGATDGSFSLALGPADNVLMDATKRAEWHVAFVKWTYNGGAGVGEKEIAFRVTALRFSP